MADTASPIGKMNGRQVLRCANCNLVQFRNNASTLCVRCKKPLFADEHTDTPDADEKVPRSSSATKSPSEILRTNIRAIRKAKCMSQSDLSRLLHTPRSWISMIESGKKELIVTNLVNFANALDVTVKTLLTDWTVGTTGNEEDIIADLFLSEIAPFVINLPQSKRLELIDTMKSLSCQRKHRKVGRRHGTAKIAA